MAKATRAVGLESQRIIHVADIDFWCTQTFGKDATRWKAINYNTWLFFEENDAAMFVLRWRDEMESIVEINV
mgnify:CR=1 FL=1